VVLNADGSFPSFSDSDSAKVARRKSQLSI
jgi:hypothetical protein